MRIPQNSARFILHSALTESIHDLHRPEAGIIRSNQLIFHAAPQPLNGQLVGIGVQVTVVAPADAVAFEHLDDLPALIAPVAWRIVEEHQLLFFPCCGVSYSLI